MLPRREQPGRVLDAPGAGLGGVQEVRVESGRTRIGEKPINFVLIWFGGCLLLFVWWTFLDGAQGSLMVRLFCTAGIKLWSVHGR